MDDLIFDLARFLERGKTPWHAVNEIGSGLALEDFELLEEGEPWQLKASTSYFLIRGGALVAFRMPTSHITSMRILGSHTDSPGLKLKPQAPPQNENMIVHGTEVYGGPILSSWFGRPLCIAGQITICDVSDQITQEVICLDDMPCIIPHLAIHLDREVNSEGHKIDKQANLLPILALSGEKIDTKRVLEEMIHRHLFFKELIASDLFLAPLEPPTFIGVANEMISSYRLDNLLSAHACLRAIIEAPAHQSQLQMAIFWNHEEVGSQTREGASSTLFTDTFERITQHMSLDQKAAIKANALCYSADAAHAYHPGYGSKHDPDHHPVLGGGIVIKHNANMRYTTDCTTSAHMITLCKEHNIPYQHFVSHNNIPCGSTIGPHFSTATGIPTIDIGSPLLGMHAAHEVASTADHRSLCKLLLQVLTH